MSTELETAPGLLEHPPQPAHSPEARPVRRVGLLDRVALHLGVALIKWGRRPVRPDVRTRPDSDREVEQARRDMERLRARLSANITRVL